MMQIPPRRLWATILAMSAPAAAQTAPESPQPTPAQAPSGSTATPAPIQQQAQPTGPQTMAAAPANSQQPDNNSAPPASGNPIPPASGDSGYAAASTRDANNNNNYNNNKRSDPGSASAFNSGEDAAKPQSKTELPVMSIRVDPFNWLLAGRLGFELESQVWKFISVELVPIFIVNDQPPYLNTSFIGVANTLHQSSAGVGPIAGTSVGVGFWLNGTPLEGYVLRAEITDYVINYDARDAAGPIDHVKYAEREFQVLFGQHSKWGPFTLAGTFGIGTVLNRQQRCFTDYFDNFSAKTSGCANNKQMMLAVTRPTGTDPIIMTNLNGWLYPMDLVLRISLGVVF